MGRPALQTGIIVASVSIPIRRAHRAAVRSGHALGEYVGVNVLDSLEPNLLDFLLRPAYTKTDLHRIGAALTDNRRSRSVLEEIYKKERDLFSTATDPEGSWFNTTTCSPSTFCRSSATRRSRTGTTPHSRAVVLRITSAQPGVDHLILAGLCKHAVRRCRARRRGSERTFQMSMFDRACGQLPAQHADCARGCRSTLLGNVVLAAWLRYRTPRWP